jgi:D-arabinose 1-dehydrogenase-like Zn-dependent alcohol dehydrogenase
MTNAGNSKSGNTMRAARVPRPGAPFELVDVPIPEPGRDQVRVKVEACGVCHSDSITKEGIFPGIPYPISPGHEVIGRVDAVGEGVDQWKVGQRVGLGWYGGHCGKCEPCRRGDLVLCRRNIITGVAYNGGYAEYLVAPGVALAAVPDELDSVEAAPLLCAGITTMNALRNSSARAGDLVAILGLGGLGHLGVQYAAKMGFETVAIARGQDKADFSRKLGAAHYIDNASQDMAAELKKLGGARLILATITEAGAMSEAAKGLGYRGELVVVGVPQQPIEVSVLNLIQNRQAVSGWASGTAIDSEDTLRFSARQHVLPMVERYPLGRAAEAYDRMMSGKARFRVVLDMSS